MRKYKQGFCNNCETVGDIYAKGLCKKCYSSDLYSKKKNDPEFRLMKKKWSKNDYLKNRDKLLEKQRKLRSENPELYKQRVRESMFKRRSKLKEKGMVGNEQYLFGGNRLKALQRDGFKCLICGLTMDDSKTAYKMPLVVHHIDGNGFNIKEVKSKNNNLSNLATLCVSCHIKEHKRIKDGNLPRTIEELKNTAVL